MAGDEMLGKPTKPHARMRPIGRVGLLRPTNAIGFVEAKDMVCEANPVLDIRDSYVLKRVAAQDFTDVPRLLNFLVAKQSTDR